MLNVISSKIPKELKHFGIEKMDFGIYSPFTVT